MRKQQRYSKKYKQKQTKQSSSAYFARTLIRCITPFLHLTPNLLIDEQRSRHWSIEAEPANAEEFDTKELLRVFAAIFDHLVS